MEEFNYSVALDVWMAALKAEPDNSNVNYKVGVCLWKLPNKKYESLPYFQKAVKNVAERYDPFSPGEKAAPVEAYFYIAEAYHLNYEFDSAVVYYNEFKNLINHNHEFWARTDLNIKQCEYGKEQVMNPVDIQVINLGELVNSEYQDYAPVVAVDESAVYFTSKRLRSDSSNLYAKNPEDGEYYEDIYVTYKGDDNAWGTPEALNFNTSSNEATLSLSADGERLYVYKVGEKGLGDIYYSDLDGMTWTEPKKLGSDINTEYHETHACVSPDGRRLYFISNRKGSMKFPDKAHEKVESRDIYFCNLLPTGDWALAQPLTELNTPYHEDGVFLHPDGKTMFFSSEGHQSMGGFDIFVSEFGDDSTWSKPENIGYPINTTGDDIFFVTSASGKRAYYSSIRDDGYGEKDLYVISMLSFKEKPLTLLIGKITSSDGTEIPDGIYVQVTDNESGETVGTFKPRARDSKFTIIIPPGSDYHLDYTYNDSVFYQDDIFVPENSAYQEIEKAISLGAIDFSSIKKKEPAAEPTAKSGSEHPSIEGNLKYGAAGAAGVMLALKDKDQSTLQSTSTDGSGNFEFNDLNAGTPYFIVIDAQGGQVPDNAQMYIKDKETGAMLPVSKLSSGAFGFETLPYIPAEEMEVMEEEEEEVKPTPAPVVAATPKKKVEKAKTPPPAYKTEVREIDGDKYIIHKVEEDESLFSISVLYNLKFPVVQEANPNKGELIYPGEEVILPIPTEVQFYQEFFDYNQKELKVDGQDYANFIAQLEKAVNENGKAILMIESSASKVPSAKFGDNEKLSVSRADAAKDAVTKSAGEKGIGSDKLNFADISTLVRGPEYQNDAAENRATYKNYQYVKIIVK